MQYERTPWNSIFIYKTFNFACKLSDFPTNTLSVQPWKSIPVRKTTIHLNQHLSAISWRGTVSGCCGLAPIARYVRTVSLRNATCVVITWILRFFAEEDAQTMLGIFFLKTRSRRRKRGMLHVNPCRLAQTTDQILIESQYRQFRSHTNLSSQIRKQQLKRSTQY